MKVSKAIYSLIVISLVTGLSVAGTSAFFSDAEASKDNSLLAGAIDLKIDNESYYNGKFNEGTSWEKNDLTDQLFFNFDDLKPGDWGEDTISLHVDNNDAWVCSNVKLTSSKENNITEPEAELDDDLTGVWDGELDQELNFVFWSDDGDNVLEEGEKILLQGKPSQLPQGNGNGGVDFPIVDSKFNAFGEAGNPFPGSETKYIGKAWCFGKLTLAPVEEGDNSPTKDPGIKCEGESVSNISQSDSLTGDVTFTAIQARNNANFECDDCIKGPVYATDSLDVVQGKRKNGSNVAPERSNPPNAFGDPDAVFFSLGFGGVATFTFGNPVVNVDGNDLSFHEITNNRNSYPLEKMKVEVSQNNSVWFNLGEVTSEPGGDGVMYKDFGSTGLGWIKYMRLTDTSNPAIHDATADGYDIDALDAVRIDICKPLVDER